jgi:two-component system, LytTR family, response regulator
MYRVLIVDDEPLARDRIRRLLNEESDMMVIGECADGISAVNSIKELLPDLVFLDVQMPEMDGLRVLHETGGQSYPAIVFVTAYDSYAIQAFEVHAVDYLLKPFDRQRFQGALQRVRQRLGEEKQNKLQSQIHEFMQSLGKSPQYHQRLAVKSDGRVILLNVTDVEWLESAGNYICLHVGKQTHIIRETLNQLEEHLDPKHFVRIHRSAIVNMDRVQELRPYFHGDYKIILHNGVELSLSRKYRDELTRRMGIDL